MTLTLVPIVVGAALYGPAGAWLGFVFGAVVLVACITNAAPPAASSGNLNPFTDRALCIVKGAAAGWVCRRWSIRRWRRRPPPRASPAPPSSAPS